MILLDTNVMLAAQRADHPHHGDVHGWFKDLTSGSDQFGVPSTVWASYLRLTTNRRIFKVPTPVADAFAFLVAVRSQPNHLPVEPGDRHFALLEELCRQADAVADLVPDAALAAIAIEHGLQLVSFDRDFARFPGLRWRLPGEAEGH